MGKVGQSKITKGGVFIVNFDPKLYGRKIGHKLSSTKLNLLNHKLPRLVIEKKVANEYLVKKIKSKGKKITLEIGFGSGENILHMLDNEKDTFFLGCEPFITGVANFLYLLEEKYFDRVNLFCGDFRILLELIKEKVFSRIIILFPDPWPKSRHKKRRIINKYNLELFSNVLIDRGYIYIATDIKDYFHEIKKAFENNNKYKIINDNFLNKPSELSETKYSLKAIKNFRYPYYITAQKTSG